MPDSSISHSREHPDTPGDIWGGAVHPEYLPPEHPKRKRYTKEQVIEALTLSRGLQTLAAKHLGCDTSTIKAYCKRYAAVREVCDEQRRLFIDTAELQLVAAVQRGDMQAVFWTLSRLGRDRGYGDRTEITGEGGGPIQHAHIHLWEERLQAVHTAMAEKKAAILLAQQAGGGYGEPVDPA